MDGWVGGWVGGYVPDELAQVLFDAYCGSFLESEDGGFGWGLRACPLESIVCVYYCFEYWGDVLGALGGWVGGLMGR